jgi:hypothetical protein
MTVGTWDESQYDDLADGTRIYWVRDDNGRALGLIEEHDHTEPGKPKRRSMGSVPIDPNYLPGGAHWSVAAGTAGTLAGLTLTPSIACHTCPHHGWIRDGQWVDA